ncbi:MAG: methyltransferase [Candidatus Methylumidiphilus sp.]
MSTNPISPLQDAFYGHWLSQAIITLHRLGIPGHLQRHAAPSLENLSEAIGADTRSLWQLLEIAKRLDAIEQDTQGHYRLTELGMRMLPEREDSFIPFLDNILTGYAAWGELAYSVQTGKPAFDRSNGVDIYGYLSQNPEQSAFFNRFMEQTTNTWLAEAGKHYGFSGRVIDIGGNQGTLSAMLLKQFPELEITLFDLEHAVKQASPLLEAAGTADRCRIVAGSFFEPGDIPKDGDIYLLSRVLLNWNDDQAAEILHNCRQAMPTGSKLLILEFALAENAGLDSLLGSLNLLVMFGSRLRTQAEFEHLLDRAGFGQFRWIAAATGELPLFYLEATPG